MGTVKNITGRQYGKLTAIEFTGRLHPVKPQSAIWIWQCECGNFTNRALVNVYKSHSHGKTPACSDCVGLSRRKYNDPLMPTKNTVIAGYKYGAKTRDLEWWITDDHINRLFVANCHYCDTPPSNIRTTLRGEFVYQGIDRVDNKLDYVPFNVVPCCAVCNRAKNSMRHEDFIEWTKRFV